MAKVNRLTRAMDARMLRGGTLGRHEVETIRDLPVPMADGTILLADLYRPIDADPTLPTILIRGPYGRRGPIGPGRLLAYEGFTVIFQSCRGTSGSGGTFVPQIDDERDGIETVRWVRKQPWFTGHLATYGESYMGYTQWAIADGMAKDPDAPEAYILQITMPDFGAITWDNGTLALRNALGWSRMMDRLTRGTGLGMLSVLLPDPKLERAFDVLPLRKGDSAATGHPIAWYQDWIQHEKLTDQYWTQQSHAKTVITKPVYMITGWYDIFLPWQLRDYARLAAAGNAPRITIGPWGHVTPGKAAPAISESAAFLKETFADGAGDRAAPVRAFQTGAEEWHDLPVWPPVGSAGKEWFLGSGGRLVPDPVEDGTTTYSYDPARPTPAVGGPSLLPKTTPVDNAAHEKRDDVLTFQTATLTEPLEIAGEPIARIRIRSSAPSFDVFIRITDVAPDGTSMTVCDGIRRIGSIATTATDPRPDKDGFREVELRLWPTFHRFAAGHRASIQVSSGAHPRYARNPGSGQAAFEAADIQIANQELAHGGAKGSRIELPVWAH